MRDAERVVRELIGSVVTRAEAIAAADPAHEVMKRIADRVVRDRVPDLAVLERAQRNADIDIEHDRRTRLAACTAELHHAIADDAAVCDRLAVVERCRRIDVRAKRQAHAIASGLEHRRHLRVAGARRDIERVIVVRDDDFGVAGGARIVTAPDERTAQQQSLHRAAISRAVTSPKRDHDDGGEVSASLAAETRMRCHRVCYRPCQPHRRRRHSRHHLAGSRSTPADPDRGYRAVVTASSNRRSSTRRQRRRRPSTTRDNYISERGLSRQPFHRSRQRPLPRWRKARWMSRSAARP